MQSIKFHIRRWLSTSSTSVIPLDECRRFITDCMLAVGSSECNAEALANVLVEADYRGHFSHGMQRLFMYVEEIEHGVCKVNAVPEVMKQTPATAWVDGRTGLGAAIGNFCMDLAIKKAEEVGVGMVVCKGSNHYGISAMYCMQAMKKRLIGVCFTNSAPFVAPTGSKHVTLGTNPISMAAPGCGGDSFVLDMATSAVAKGKIEMKMRTKSPIPAHWMHPETKALQPLGGDENNSSFKGYGLAMFVEILCGILGGGAYGPSVRKFFDYERLADLGHCFIAVDPGRFAPGFEERLSDFLHTLRNVEPLDPKKPVLVAGDVERFHMESVNKAGGIQYVQDVLDTCKKLAERLKVKPLQQTCREN